MMTAALEPIGQGSSHQYGGGFLGVVGTKVCFIVKVIAAETECFRGSVIGEILNNKQENNLSGGIFVEVRIVCDCDEVKDVPELMANRIGTVGVSASQKVRS